ncbi:unnamed protein product [Ambrosiozyma monospora]|uniref:Unnamed protein product n=1 Tax=Ambrosiozyma monospora TaxID=43982 RepID=A0ACB5T1M1_AMBMO|nr:unnamed protein product [Ambrosiozyma monospora]
MESHYQLQSEPNQRERNPFNLPRWEGSAPNQLRRPQNVYLSSTRPNGTTDENIHRQVRDIAANMVRYNNKTEINAFNTLPINGVVSKTGNMGSTNRTLDEALETLFPEQREIIKERDYAMVRNELDEMLAKLYNNCKRDK